MIDKIGSVTVLTDKNILSRLLYLMVLLIYVLMTYTLGVVFVGASWFGEKAMQSGQIHDVRGIISLAALGWLCYRTGYRRYYLRRDQKLFFVLVFLLPFVAGLVMTVVGVVLYLGRA